jgi:hypothetical protein
MLGYWEKKDMRNTVKLSVGVLLLRIFILHASEVIYEPFDYLAATIDGASQNGGTGMTGSWSSSGSNPYAVISSGLSFTNLPTAGNKVARTQAPGSAEVNRLISAASQSALTSNDSTIWFSALINDKVYSAGYENGALLLATGPLSDSNSMPPNIAGGSGIGFCMKTVTYLHAIIIDGGSSSYSSNSLAMPGDNNTYLIVGKIEWAANGSDDTIRLFNIADPSADAPANGDAFATMTADLDQSAFDTLAIGNAQVSFIDEIRYALSYYEAVGRIVPPPAGTIITIK